MVIGKIVHSDDELPYSADLNVFLSEESHGCSCHCKSNECNKNSLPRSVCHDCWHGSTINTYYFGGWCSGLEIAMAVLSCGESCVLVIHSQENEIISLHCLGTTLMQDWRYATVRASCLDCVVFK